MPPARIEAGPSMVARYTERLVFNGLDHSTVEAACCCNLFYHNATAIFKVLQYTGGHDLFSIGRRRSPAVSTADIPLVSQGAFFQHIHASEPEH